MAIARSLLGGEEVVKAVCVSICMTGKEVLGNLMVGEGNQHDILVGNHNTSGRQRNVGWPSLDYVSCPFP